MNFQTNISTDGGGGKTVELSAGKTASRTFGYIIPLCVLSLLLSGVVISVTNDMYAFVKPDREITVNIAAGSSLYDVSEQLGSSGVIMNPAVFRLYVSHKGKAEAVGKFCGELTLNSDMSYRTILLAMT